MQDYLTTLSAPALPTFAVAPSHTIPMVKRHADYRRGWSLREAEVFDGATVDLDALSEDERRGYKAACRCEADSDTAAYLMAQEVSR